MHGSERRDGPEPTLLSLGDSGKLVGSRRWSVVQWFVVLTILQQPVGFFRWGRGTRVQLPLSCRFSCWHGHCLFGERIWVATGHTDRGSQCERQHFRTGAIASRIARFD